MAPRSPIDPLTRRHVIRLLGSSGLLLAGTPALLSLGCDGKGGEDPLPPGEPIRFAVITDMHLKPEADHANNLVMAETIEILDAMDPPVDLVLLTGDLLDDLPSDDPADYTAGDSSLDRLAELLDGLDVPWLAVLGNHDYYLNEGAIGNDLTDDLEAREALLLDQLDLPGLWFRHDHRGVAFYGLNTMQTHPDAGWTPGSVGSFGPDQVDWLADQLADGAPAVLFFHHPLALDNAVSAGFSAAMPFEVPRAEGGYAKYEGTEYEDWTDPIYDLLAQHADQVLAVFVGHGHWFVQDDLDGAPVMMTDSVGNSVLQTSLGEDDDAVPMRYHLVEIDPATATLAVTNDDWFTYNP